MNRTGPVDVSLEMTGVGVLPRADEPGIVLPFVLPSPYRGIEGRPGWTLTGIALMREGHPPGARGSAMWAWVPVAEAGS